MKYEYTDQNNTKYVIEFNTDYPFIEEPHFSLHSNTARTTKRLLRIVDDVMVDWNYDDRYYVSDEAKQYIDKLVKNRAFV